MKPFSSAWQSPLSGLALLGTLATPFSQVHADTATPMRSQVGTVAGKLMLRFKPGSSTQDKKRALAQVGGVIKHTYSTGWTLVQVPQSSTGAAVNKLKSLPQVAGAEPDYKWKSVKPIPANDTIRQLRSASTASSNIPNDPLYPQQWALERVGAPEAWKTTTGSKDIVIADMDSGIALDNVDLIPNTFTNTAELNGQAGVDDDNNGFVDDVHGWNSYLFNGNVEDVFVPKGHGTHTAGIIGAAGNNGQLISGVNWQVTIVPIVLSDVTENITSDSIAGAIDYILALRKQGVNVRAVNCSFGDFDNAIQRATVDSFKVLDAAGVLIVCADGNDNRNTDKTTFLPAGLDLPNVISVGASNYTDDRWYWSNYGLNSVDIFAPGANILSTVDNFPTALDSYSGTSMAAPMVTGAAALLWASQPNLTPAQVKQRLLASAKRVEQLRPFVKEVRRLDVGALLNNAVHSIAGTTVTSDGKSRVPIGGVSIYLDDHTGTPDATTNAKGGYALSAIGGGPHTVRAELGGQPFGTPATLNLPTSKAANPGIYYANFKSLTTSQRYALYGRAYQITAGGKQVSKPNVDVYLNDGTTPFARTDRYGNFKISNLAQGRYAVRMVDAIGGQKASNTPVIYLPNPQPKSEDYPESPDGYATGRFVFTDIVAPYVESTSIKKGGVYTAQTAPKFFSGTITDDSTVDSMTITLYRYKPDFSVVEMYDAANKKWVNFFTNAMVSSGSFKGNGQAQVAFQLPLPTLEAGYNYELHARSYDNFNNEGLNSFPFQVQGSSAPSTNSLSGSPSAGSS